MHDALADHAIVESVRPDNHTNGESRLHASNSEPALFLAEHSLLVKTTQTKPPCMFKGLPFSSACFSCKPIVPVSFHSQ